MSALTYVVAEDGTEVPDNVDDEEDCALLGTHGKVATLGVTLNRMCLGSGHERVVNPVSYTHLTLPTIYSV